MHRGPSTLGVAVCAALGLVSAGCLDETAIVLRVVGAPAMNGTFDRLSFTILQPDRGGGPPASWLAEMATDTLPYEVAFVPGATIGLGDVSITVTANAGDSIVARGTVGAVLEDGKVVEISLPLAPLGCVPDAYEAVESVGGTLNPKNGYADLTLCPDDDQDTPGLYAPASFDVHLGINYVEPYGAVEAAFVCTSFGGEVYGEPPQPGELAYFFWTSTTDATCRLVVDRAPGFEGATVYYAIDYWLYPNVPCIDDALGPTPENVTVDGPFPYDLMVGTERTSCPGMPDVWTIDAPAGTVLGAEVVPTDGSDPSYYTVSLGCPETPSLHWSNGGTFARTGPLSGPSRATCVASVDGGLPNGTFGLRLRAGDYATCVDDADEPDEPLDLSFREMVPLTICRAPGDLTGDVDELFIPDLGAPNVCVSISPDPIPGAEEGNLLLTVEGSQSGEIAFAYTSGGVPQEACVGPFLGTPGDVTATVECSYGDPGALAGGCGQVYDVLWYWY